MIAGTLTEQKSKDACKKALRHAGGLFLSMLRSGLIWDAEPDGACASFRR